MKTTPAVTSLKSRKAERTLLNGRAFDAEITMKMRKISVVIKGHATSVSLEPEFHNELQKLCRTQGLSLSAFIAKIDEERTAGQNLSSALRLEVLHHLKRQVPPQSPK